MSDLPSINLLHTNDFHNRLSPALAEHIKNRKQQCGLNTLLIDAGDAISAGNVGVRIGGEPILELMNSCGYDAMTMGNREFHIADTVLRHKILNAAFPILCANIRYQKDTAAELPVVPYLRTTMENGLNVAIIGVTVPMVTSRMAARVVSAYLFDDPVSVVTSLVQHLRGTSDVIIALTHIGFKEDQRLASACPDLDLIIGGHSHVVLSEPHLIGDVPILQAGWFGHYIGEATLTMDGSKARLSSAMLEDVRGLGSKGAH